MSRIRLARWYEQYGRALRAAPEIITTNYGWVDLEGELPVLDLSPEEEPSRFPLNLYALAASGARIEGRDVLEVGSGRGGGARLLVRTFSPRTYRGVDRSSEAIEFASSGPVLPGLTFVHGDAERLPAEDKTFDVVLSIEAAHAYGRMDRVVSELARVLRPGGRLSLVDFGSRDDLDRLAAGLEAGGLRVSQPRDLTAGVVESIGRRQPQVQALAARLPAEIQEVFLSFAAAEGSVIEARLKNGGAIYFQITATVTHPN